MLKIADYARRYEMEWYEVMRLCISDETTIQPIAILTHGELRVFELDDDELIGDFPGLDPISLAYEECEMNPAFLARLIHAKFPVVFKPVTKNKEGLASDFYQLDDMPLRPPAVKKFQGMDRVWFAFNKIVSIGLENIWIPNEPAALIKKPTLAAEMEVAAIKQTTPHTQYISHQFKSDKSKYESWTLLKKLAIHSKGTELVELPGFGPIYFKRDRKDPERTVRYSLTKFNGPDDGKTLNKHAFDNAWSRIKTRNLHETSTKPT